MQKYLQNNLSSQVYTVQRKCHPLSAVRDCLFDIFATTLHIWKTVSSIRKPRMYHAVVTETHMTWAVRPFIFRTHLNTHIKPHQHIIQFQLFGDDNSINRHDYILCAIVKLGNRATNFGTFRTILSDAPYVMQQPFLPVLGHDFYIILLWAVLIKNILVYIHLLFSCIIQKPSTSPPLIILFRWLMSYFLPFLLPKETFSTCPFVCSMCCLGDTRCG
jgi:hypothetical protein